jgi:hypothetical protein
MPLFSIQTFSQIFKREDMSNQNYSLSSNNANLSKNNGNQSTSKLSSNIKGFLNKPDNKKDSKSDEFKSNNPPKASFLDSTDPNETGRNTAQIIFEQEKEDKKTLGKTPPPPPSSSSSTTTSKIKKENDETTS